MDNNNSSIEENEVPDFSIWKNVSINIMRKGSRDFLSESLNGRMIFKSDTGRLRDWRGLGELCGLSSQFISNLHSHPDPTDRILTVWSETKKNESTIENLFNYLEDMDRFGVVEDIIPLIENDIVNFNNNKDNSINMNKEDWEILTHEDMERQRMGLGPQIYHAFVLFVDEDIDFASRLMDTMENEYNLKLCAKNRNLLVGTLELDAQMELIATRCKRMIVILSSAFCESNMAKFLHNFAQYVGIEQKQKKIIPCSYKPGEVYPLQYRCFVTLNFHFHSSNFWQRLYNAIEDRPISNALKQSLLSLNDEASNAPKLHQQKTASRSLHNSSVKINTDITEIELPEPPDHSISDIITESSIETSLKDSTTKKKHKLNWLTKLKFKRTNKKNKNVAVITN